jgi:hypothetical protein
MGPSKLQDFLANNGVACSICIAHALVGHSGVASNNKFFFSNTKKTQMRTDCSQSKFPRSTA